MKLTKEMKVIGKVLDVRRAEAEAYNGMAGFPVLEPVPPTAEVLVTLTRYQRRRLARLVRKGWAQDARERR